MGDQAEAIEFIANGSTKFLNIPLKKLKLLEGVLVIAIARGNEVIIPHGKDIIKPRDSVILIAKNTKISDLNEVVASGGNSR